ncbi:MAG TPA: cyclase family protein [Chitinophagales bacterium]|nr:cyclase family protein [Chitinophagales bacterium]
MEFQFKGYRFDMEHPLDISTPLHPGQDQINCYYAPPFNATPIVMGNFIGDVNQGGSVNYKNVALNPHGNGTHTECVSHISNLNITINKALIQFHFLALLISVHPENAESGDKIISSRGVIEKIKTIPEALIIRTLPNTTNKLHKQYSGTNPAYFESALLQWAAENKILHFLTDLPSIDREEDGGKLLSHRAFFQYPEAPRLHSTITELIYVPNKIPDGLYLLNLQIASFELDAAPSKPVLYKLIDEQEMGRM